MDKRYRGISNRDLSVNRNKGPNGSTLQQYSRVMRHAVVALREVDTGWLVIADGMFGETTSPVPALANLPNIGHSTRGMRRLA